MIEIGGTPGKGSFTSAAARTILNNITIATTLLNGAELRLYSAGPLPNTSMLWSNFTEIVGTWYTFVAAVTWHAAGFENGQAYLDADPALFFDYSGASPPEGVKGWALVKAGVVLYAEDLDTPKNMGAVGDNLVVLPQFFLNPGV